MLQLKTIISRKIDWQDDRFLLGSFFATDERPLVFPVFYLQETKDHRYRIIGNLRTLRDFCEKAPDSTEIPAAVFSTHDDFSVLRFLFSALSSRPPGFVDSMAWLAGRLPEDSKKRELLLEEFAIDKESLDRLLFLNKNRESIARFCEMEKIGHRELKLLQSNFRKNLLSVAEAMEGLKIGGNRGIKILQNLSDLQRKEPQKFCEFLQKIQTIKNSLERADMNQKIRGVEDFLRETLYPRMLARQKEAEKKIREIRFPQGVHCRFDPEGEEKHIEISFRVESLEEYSAISETLQSRKKEIESLLKVL